MNLRKKSYILCPLGVVESRKKEKVICLKQEKRVHLSETEYKTYQMIDLFGDSDSLVRKVLGEKTFGNLSLGTTITRLEGTLSKLMEKGVLRVCVQTDEEDFNEFKLYAALHAKVIVEEDSVSELTDTIIENPDLTILDVFKYFIYNIYEPTKLEKRVDTAFKLSHNKDALALAKELKILLAFGEIELYE